MKKKTFILNSVTETSLVLLFHYLILLFLIIGFCACNKTEAVNTPPPPPPPQDTATVYIAGSSVSATTLLSIATVWKNGTPVNLLSGTSGGNNANSIFISGNDVYVLGSFAGLPTYWKNGSPVSISNNTNDFVSGIFVTK
jgi:hypothetical protein